MQTIIEKIRNLISDNLRNDGQDVFQYESITSSKLFTLTQSNVIGISIKIYKNEESESWSDDNYSYDKKLIIHEISGEELEPGDTLLVTYDYYEKYSDTELEGRIRAALSYLSVEKYADFIIESGGIICRDETGATEITLAEKNLIAVIASILINKSIRSYRTPEVTIVFNENESVSQKIKKVIRQSKTFKGVIGYIDLFGNLSVEE